MMSAIGENSVFGLSDPERRDDEPMSRSRSVAEPGRRDLNASLQNKPAATEQENLVNPFKQISLHIYSFSVSVRLT